jgi:hypothetical protein
MAKIIARQNQGILDAWWGYRGKIVTTNKELATALNIEQAPKEYEQNYVVSDVRVMVI